MSYHKSFSSILKIKTHSLPNKDPEFTVTVNGISMPLLWPDKNECQVDFLSALGPNTIAIKFLNKDPFDAVVEDGKIIHNLALEILSLTVDNISLDHQIKQNSYWADIDQPNTYGFITSNSTLVFEFICPVFLYLRNQALITPSDVSERNS
jgi:hypothetical protein